MRYNLTTLIAELWRVLNKEVTKIHLIDEAPRKSAHSEYTDDDSPGAKNTVEIWVDPHYSDILKAVIHELLHRVLDKYLTPKLTYHVYEFMITSLESPIVRKLGEKKRDWVRVIKKKTVRK